MKKILNQDTAYIKVNKEEDRVKESSKTASLDLFKILIDKLEEFIKNAYENKDQNNKSDRMKIEQSKASKLDNLY